MADRSIVPTGEFVSCLVTLMLIGTATTLAAEPRQLVPRSPHWKAELIAEAPAVRFPSIVACAPDGRVFVGEDPMDIVTAADKALGRVLCFHPDGRVTVFADKLHAPFGMMYLDGKLYIHHSPRLSLFSDDNGIGKDRLDLIECTNPNPWALDWNDHVPANIRLAMDGFLYMSVGDKGIYGAVGRDGKPAELHGGGILRLRPDATELEVFSRGTRNHLDVMISAEDDIFTYDNTDEKDWWSRLAHMVDGGDYGYPWDHKPPQPYILPALTEFGAGAATATLVYNDDALPPEYRGNLFLADFGKGQVLRVQIDRDGATFKLVSHEDFFVTVPENFRPVGLAWSPDGMSFYIGDWQHRDVKVTGKSLAVGRLWKITYTGPSHGAPRPDWYLPAAMGLDITATTAELIRGLAHPAHSVRLVAQRRLADRGDRVIEPLLTVLVDRAATTAARQHALWALDGIDGGKQAREMVLALLNDPDASIRRQAIRQLGTRRATQAASRCVTLLHDADASVRFQAATALGRIGDHAAVPALLRTLDDPDRFTRYATFNALNRIGRAEPKVWEQIAQGLESDREAVREGTLFALRNVHELPVVAALTRAVQSRTLPPETREAALIVLAGLHRQPPAWRGEWWAYHPVNLPRPAKTVNWSGTPHVVAALRQAMTDPAGRVRRAGIDGLREAGDAASATKLAGLFRDEADTEVRRSMLRALGAFKDRAAEALVAAVLSELQTPGPVLLEAIVTAEQIGARTTLMKYLQSVHDNTEAVREAVRALGRMQAVESVTLLLEYLNHREFDLRIAAIEALSRVGGDRSAEAIVRLIGDADVYVRRAAIVALGQLKYSKAVPALNKAYLHDETRFDAAAALANIPDARAIDAYLFGLGSSSESLRASCRKAIAAIAAQALPLIESRLDTGLLPGQVILELRQVFDREASRKLHLAVANVVEPAAYLDYALNHAGDPERGRSLFFDAKGLACSKCHRVAGEGTDLGPDLSGVGAQYSRKDLAESILFPSKVIREGFQSVTVATSSGLIAVGLVRGETPETLTLCDAEGRTHVLRKAEIDERKTSGVSLMPDGLNTGLSLDDFADVVSFLETLKKKPD